MTCHPQGHLTNRLSDLHSVILLFAVMDTFITLPLLLFLPPITVFLSNVYDANKTKVTARKCIIGWVRYFVADVPLLD